MFLDNFLKSGTNDFSKTVNSKSKTQVKKGKSEAITTEKVSVSILDRNLFEVRKNFCSAVKYLAKRMKRNGERYPYLHS